jgi:hypothetical protein
MNGAFYQGLAGLSAAHNSLLFDAINRNLSARSSFFMAASRLLAELRVCPPSR